MIFVEHCYFNLNFNIQLFQITTRKQYGSQGSINWIVCNLMQFEK